jgi:hypothetical protein
VKTAWPFSTQRRQLELELEDLPLPDEKGCELGWKREGDLSKEFFL